MSPPDGLLTKGNLNDVDLKPHISTPDPFVLNNCLDDSSPDLFPPLLTKTDNIDTMNTGEDESSSGLNGRLRPRKSTVSSTQSKVSRKSEVKSNLDRIKQTCSPAKASPKKLEDLITNKSDTNPDQHLLCPYCEKKFAYKQTVSKHVRRVHLLASKQDAFLFGCLFCNHNETEPNKIIQHMVDSHPNQYFACLDCHTRFPSTTELAEHKLNVCERQKTLYKPSQKSSPRPKQNQKKFHINRKVEFQNHDGKDYSSRHGFNGIVISCELKPTQVHDEADIEDNITTNVILPPSKTLTTSTVLDKNAVIVLDDIQWQKRMPPNFTFHNADADQILSRLGVVHRSPRTGESNRRDWLKALDETTQKFEKCFDTSFYSKVASNVQENLAKFLDGSFNFNPDPDSTIKTRKSKNSVVINTAEGFPILLAYEQYSRNIIDGHMPRAIAPRHKWKWDNLENDKNIMNPDQIKRDSHVNNCIITLVSSLDIWTQLCMKRKFEEKFRQRTTLQKKVDRQNILGQELKEILESRQIPTSSSTSSQVVKYSKPTPPSSSLEFPALLGLKPTAPHYELNPAVLSGEWVRPRCYVCCACGAQSRDSRALSSHISTQHPNSQVQHYEIVGEMLLNADIMKHLYVPPSQVSNRTRPMRGFKECTKCKNSVTLEDLHQHMLDCAGDTPAVRRKCRYRPFGVRRRRPRLPDNTIRKRIRKDLRSRQRQKGHMRSRPRIRTEVGDAETIRKMIADLPAKRHRVLVNPMNSNLRPRKKLNKQIKLKKIIRRAPYDRRVRPLKDPKKSDDAVPGLNENDMINDDTIHNDIEEEEEVTVINDKEDVEIIDNEKDNDNNPTDNDKEEDDTFKNEQDDDDDLPLKQRPKRFSGKVPRQHESFKRKTRREIEDQNSIKAPDINPDDLPGNEESNLSNDNIPPERVDVNGGPVNMREHSGRGRSNNRGNQPPGGSRQENNPNHAHIPPQNTPLKHSIARLTADSETHDKSVQFHHSFLVQQECNNVTQESSHVPTERRRIFENEEAASPLDKPPLPHEKPMLDPVALQKSKLNKPRKDLKTCIDMLKNKLVDPISSSTGHVSVQCGTDEPLDLEKNMVPSIDMFCEPQIELKPAEIYSRHTSTVPQKEDTIKPIQSNRNRSATFQRSSSFSLDAAQREMQQMSIIKPTVAFEAPLPPKQKNYSPTPVKRKSSRRRSATYVPSEPNVHSQLSALSSQLHSSHAAQMAHALHLFQLPPVLQLPHVAQPPRGYNESQLMRPSTSYRKTTEPHNLKVTRTRSRRAYNKKIEPSVDFAVNPRTLEVNVDNQPLPKKSRPRVRSQTDTVSENTTNRMRLVDQRSPEIYAQISPPKPKSCVSSNHSDSTMPVTTSGLITQEVNRRASNDDIYIDSILNEFSVSTLPAHLSTRLEYVTPVPLDLSGTSLLPDCPPVHPNMNNTYVTHSYDTYDTLDLSKKKSSYAVNVLTEPNICDVVDLRIKPPEQLQLSGQTRSLIMMSPDLAPLNDSDIITDLSLKTREDDNMPKDLSLKRKNTPTFDIIPSQSLNYDIQDLSGHKSVIDVRQNSFCQEDPEKVSINEPADNVPTDLSSKKYRDITSISSPELETDIDDGIKISVDDISDTDIQIDILQETPADLSSTAVVSVGYSTLDHITPVSDDVTERCNVVENINRKDESTNLAVSYVSSSNIISNPLYDPTLKISQYNLKSSTTGTISSESNVNIDLYTHTPTSIGVSQIATTLVPAFTSNTVISTQNACLIPSQETLSYGFISSSQNINTFTGNIPLYTFTNARPSLPVNRFECTKPVYTLATACISVTKIETSNPATLTNTKSSVPGNTIASTTSVYTLAGIPKNYCCIMPNVLPPLGQNTNNLLTTVSVPTSDPIIISTSQSSYSDDKDFGNPKNAVGVTLSEQDPETAKKIAMLPKELVEILGTMPVGHRTQLLNVLPQYVSTPAAGTVTAYQENATVQRGETFEVTSLRANSESYSNIDGNRERPMSRELKANNVNLAEFSTRNSKINPFTALDENFEHDKKHNISSINSGFSHKNQLKLSPNRNDMRPAMNRTENDHRLDSLIQNKDNYDPTIGAPANMSAINFVTESTVIDLTVDERLESSSFDVNLSKEVHQSTVQRRREELAMDMIKLKSGNKETASLRAVRIKAPSERNKPNVIDLEAVPKNVELPSQILASDQEVKIDKNILPSNTILGIQSGINATENNIKKNIVIENQTSFTTSTISQSKISEGLSVQYFPIKPVVSQNIIIASDKKSSISPLRLEVVHEKPPHVTESHVKSPPSAVPLEVRNTTVLTESYNINVDFTEDTSLQNLTHVQNTVTDIESIKEPQKVKEDEDSEDDISLAVISKQKKHDQSMLNVYEEMEPQDNTFVKNKKEKNIQETNETGLEVSVSSDIGDDNFTFDSKNHKQVDTISSDNISLNFKNTENNQTRNPVLNSSVSEVFDYQNENNDAEPNMKNEDLGKENVIFGDSLTAPIEKITTDKPMTESDCIQISSKETELISNHIIRVKKYDEYTSTKELEIRSDTLNKLSVIYSNEIGLQNQFSDKNIGNVSTIDLSIKNKDNIKNNMKKEVTDCGKKYLPDGSAVLVADSKPNLHTEKNDYELCNVKTGIHGNDESNSVNTDLSLEEEKNASVPLRRSMRGKSTFLENPSIENVLPVPEISNEQKPLTKKQLIFSKLLLDEGNQSALCKDLQVENTKCSKKDMSSDTITITSVSQASNEAYEFTNRDAHKKATKRKISVHTKCKIKKTKALEASDLDESDNSLSIDINMALHKHEEEKLVKQTEEVIPGSSNQNSQISLDESIKEISDSIMIGSEKRENEIHEDTSVRDKIGSDKSKNVDNKLIYETTFQKRKLCFPTVTADIGHLPKLKKSKHSKEENQLDLEDTHEEHKTIEHNSKYKKDKSTCSDIRTACYNKSATKRTRSKSVVVKSTLNEFYDPYDIDLDEMIEKPESCTKKTSHGERLDEGDISVLPKAIKSIKSKNVKVSRTIKTSKKEKKLRKNNITSLRCTIEDSSHISDSDDSSKSDVPLKRYMEEKVKKLRRRVGVERESDDDMEIDQSESSDEKQNDDEDHRCRKTLAVFNNKDAVATSSTETEEQLRSEQFMESFGFFSERKPRKSNLLASKKISETFHIIANESEDIYYEAKERSAKKSLQNENRKANNRERNKKANRNSISKKANKRGRKKKTAAKIEPSNCVTCNKQFKRADNFLRHLMSLIHVSKVSEVEMKEKTIPIHEEPNYLIVYKQHLDRLKILTDKQKKNSKSAPKIVLPTMAEIVAEVSKTVREQLSRGLSRDEALFIDCCELLKESHKKDLVVVTEVKLTTDLNAYACEVQAPISELDLITKRLNEDNSKNDGDVDSITAKTILESEEVRNLENDLISGLKEAAHAKEAALNANKLGFPRSIDDIIDPPQQIQVYENPDMNYSQADESIAHIEESNHQKQKKPPDVKQKMYPDIVINNIDMYEDKFDKIKRKCRSQAAAAKQAQTKEAVEPPRSYKVRKRSEKKKAKKVPKKNYRSTQVLTKGALKGFDGIKVSIPTSDINMSAIVSTLEMPSKKKKKGGSKKKRETKSSESSGKGDNNNRAKESSTLQRKVDVYEFMDNEDVELFELRPSTLMERFKIMSNKNMPSTSKFNQASENADMSEDHSVSDGDDFVYMSDDYICSDDGTENSLISCEASATGKVNTETKKSITSQKRKDTLEKNAVMGKIFKNNAVRTEKKSIKVKETGKVKTNLDQLFDSLLEDGPSSSMLNSDVTPKKEDKATMRDKLPSYNDSSPHTKTDSVKSHKNDTQRYSSKNQDLSSDNFDYSPRKIYDTSIVNFGASTSKQYSNYSEDDFGPSTSKKRDVVQKERKSSSPIRKHESKSATSSKKKSDRSSKSTKKSSSKHHYDYNKKHERKFPSKKLSKDTIARYDLNAEQLEQYCSDEEGVARQRARRKCTVGKQNVLAETWSSESEPDGGPVRPNSAESTDTGGRRRKGRKKDGSLPGARRGTSRQVSFRKLEDSVGDNGAEDDPGGRASWMSDVEDEPEHVQQHGWIVGDSHKKLVTMLAHAKGRKRNNDDKRPLLD